MQGIYTHKENENLKNNAYYHTFPGIAKTVNIKQLEHTHSTYMDVNQFAHLSLASDHNCKHVPVKSPRNSTCRYVS
jgi:hypothetical protein